MKITPNVDDTVIQALREEAAPPALFRGAVPAGSVAVLHWRQIQRRSSSVVEQSCA